MIYMVNKIYNIIVLNIAGDQNPILRLKVGVEKSKVTSTLWGPLDQSLITGHEDGTIVQWDLKVS